MPLKEDRDKILESVSKKVDGISKVMESLYDITKKQNEVTSDQVAKQEETESESKVLLNEDKKYRIKTTKLLEEIRDKEINVSTESGLGSLISGITDLLGGLGIAGLAGSLIGLTAAINELKNWFDGKETPVINKPGMAAGTSSAADIGASGAATRATAKTVSTKTLKNLIQGKPLFSPLPEREFSRIAGEKAKTAITGKKPISGIGPQQKATPFERVKAGTSAVGRATGAATMSAVSAGRSAFLGGTALGVSTLFDPNLQNVPFADRLKQAGVAFGKGSLSAGLVDLGISTTANAFSAAGLPSLARAVPIVGLMYGASEALYRAYTASDWSRGIAESEMLDQGRMDLENTNKQVEIMGQEALKLANEGKINEAKIVEERAVKMVENAQKNFFALHNIVKTHEKLNNVVDMDLAWGKGEKYSIQDVNTILETFKDARNINNSDDLYKYYLKKGADKKINSVLNRIGFDNVFMLLKEAPEILKDYNTNLWARPKEYFNKYGSELISAAQREEQERKHREAVNEAYGQYAGMMANEGIIEGSRFGSFIVAGENRTSEAVVSTKPNAVTESIGNNIYKIIKENALNDITATQRQTMVLGTVLANTVQEYNDAYKIAPLLSGSSSSSNPIIVNNMIGGMNSGRLLETNGHFNSAGTIPDKHESVLEKVYMDYYKAAML